MKYKYTWVIKGNDRGEFYCQSESENGSRTEIDSTPYLGEVIKRIKDRVKPDWGDEIFLELSTGERLKILL